MLEVQRLTVRFDAVEALREVDIVVERGEVVAILGANGAGKSTLLRTISALNRPYGGDVRLHGESLLGRQPEEVVGLGISHVPEGRRVLGQLTVQENLALAQAAARPKENGGRGSGRADLGLDFVYELFPRLAERTQQRAGHLSGGEQQMLAVGRGLLANPNLMMLDEPTLGLAPQLVEQLFEALEYVNGLGTTLLLVEQNAAKALEVADRAYVLERGRILFSGTNQEVQEDPRIAEAYLGA